MSGYGWIKYLRIGVERWIHRIQPDAVLDSSQFPWSTEIEKNYLSIRTESFNILNRLHEITNFDNVLPNQKALTQGELWKSFFLVALGHSVPIHQQMCPVTTEMLKLIPNVENAFFSVLGPGAHVPPHRGPYAGILRYHLGLVIPEGDVAIRVDQQVCHWAEGKSLFFDDSFEHEAWNKTNQLRVILFVDFLRPLPRPLSIFNRVLLWGFTQTRAAREGRRYVLENQLRMG